MENDSIRPDQINAYSEPVNSDPVLTSVDSTPQSKNTSLTTAAAKTGGNIFMTILKVIFGGIKTFLKFFFMLSFIPKLIFLLILFFFIAISFVVGYFVGRNNFNEKIKNELEQAKIKLENIEKEIRD